MEIEQYRGVGNEVVQCGSKGAKSAMHHVNIL